ncbi:MAG: insulinase family protein [Lactobacillaceae bacterium]|nr:insulinase family protein [Lactobacillaceae bacterium]
MKKQQIYGDEIFKFVLKNGLPVTFVQKPGFSTFQMSISVLFGGADVTISDNHQENIPIPAGTAHFLEHKMFEKESGDLMLEFDRLGADSNAFTNSDITSYYFHSANKENFSQLTETLFNLVYNPYFTDESILKEREIIGQEIDRSLDDPYSMLFRGAFQNLYGDLGLSREVLGTKETISTITPNLLYFIHKKIYTPKNMTLFFAGDFSLEEVESTLEKFSPTSIQEKKQVALIQETGLLSTYKGSSSHGNTSENITSLFLRVDKNKLSVEHKVATEIVLEVFFGESSSWQQKNYEAGSINDDFEFGFELGREYGYLIFIQRASVDSAKFEKIILDNFSNVHLEGFEEEFTRVKNAKLGATIMSFDQISNIATPPEEFDLNLDTYSLTKILETMDITTAFKKFREVISDTKKVRYSVLPKK